MAAPDIEYSPDELNELLSGLMPEIPGYRVMRRIGRGGMSYVYLGVQESLDRQVAIKVMAPEALNDEVSKQRFEKEARTIAKLEHPCIVGIHEVGRTEHGLLYYVLPYLSKGHLGQRDLTRDEPRVIEVLEALLSALDYAHARGVVHRDVKAENVLFDNADRPVLTDFGIAVSKRDKQRMTGGGMVMGSIHYMAPERARGEIADARADLYSVGVLAYEMLMGRLPFENADPLGLALMHAQDAVPRLPAERRCWQALIDRAMAKSPADRYASASEMLRALSVVKAEVVRRTLLGQRARGPGVFGRVLPALRRAGAASGRVGGRQAALFPPSSSGLRWLPLVAGAVLVGAALTLALRPDTRGPPQPTISTPPQSAAGAPVAAAAPPATDRLPAAVDAAPTAAAADEPDEVDGVVANAEAVEPDETPALPPGERELAAARQQIARGRLSLPAGDNALASLRAARAVDPDLPGLAELGERWLLAATPHLLRMREAGDSVAFEALRERAGSLAEDLGLREGAAWKALQIELAAPLRAGLEAALAARDLGAVRAARARIQASALPLSLFEPAWSQPLVLLRPGDAVPGAVPLKLVRLPQGGAPGLAVMPQAVSRELFADFVAAGGQVEGRCRVRTAAMTLRKRSWDAPGYAQAGDHPVVCVRPADAEAFAAWLGAREGRRYRLPRAEELRALVDPGAGAAGCRAGGLRCGDRATLPADAGPLEALGLRSMRGNVREWLADCEAGCRERHAAGFGWRDGTARSGAIGQHALDAASGYDDVGFRLVREVAAAEIEQR